MTIGLQIGNFTYFFLGLFAYFKRKSFPLKSPLRPLSKLNEWSKNWGAKPAAVNAKEVSAPSPQTRGNSMSFFLFPYGYAGSIIFNKFDFNLNAYIR
jgi:hypothetical protein